MNNFKGSKKMSIFLIFLHVVFLDSSCAQNGGDSSKTNTTNYTGCLLLAYENRIDAMESLLWNLNKTKDKSIWELYNRLVAVK